MTDQPASGRRAERAPDSAVPRSRVSAAEGRPVLPRTSTDETDIGWGDLPDVSGGDDERILREVPPHHVG